MSGPVDVTLREVTRDNLRDVLRLRVAPHQESFVASNAVSIAQAHFHPEAWFRAVYAGDEPVGFVMLDDQRLLPEPRVPDHLYYLWRLMIDARHQGRGLGRRAVAQLIDHVRGRPDARRLHVSYVPGSGCPGPFYAGLGFVPTGRIVDGEVELVLEL